MQEFFQNSIKHAACKNIQVSLINNEDFIELILQDDGKGFDTKNANGKGIGLSNIKKRTELINGNFALQSELGKGTNLTIEIPNDK